MSLLGTDKLYLLIITITRNNIKFVGKKCSVNSLMLEDILSLYDLIFKTNVYVYWLILNTSFCQREAVSLILWRKKYLRWVFSCLYISSSFHLVMPCMKLISVLKYFQFVSTLNIFFFVKFRKNITHSIKKI